MPLKNALPPFNIISNFANNISNPKKLIESNLASSKESFKTSSAAAGVIYTVSNPKQVLNIIKKTPAAAKTVATVGGVGLAGLFGYGLLSSTKKPVELVSKAPGAAVSGGKTTGNIIESLSSGNYSQAGKEAVNYAKEHPVATAGLGLGLVYVGGKTLLPAWATFRNTGEIKESNELLKSAMETGGYTPVPSVPINDEKKEPKSSLNKTISQDTAIPMATAYTDPNTGITSWEQSSETPAKAIKKYYPAKRKAKNINTRPINIRNYNILANKNG